VLERTVSSEVFAYHRQLSELLDLLDGSWSSLLE
jgi:hypothetical protein